jgi:hypothetical protein
MRMALRNRDREQTDLKLKPAIEAQHHRQQQGTQQRLSQYFEPSRRVASIRSVRMANAVHKLGDRAAASTTNDNRHQSDGKNESGGSGVACSAKERAEPRAVDDEPLDAAAVLIQQQTQRKKVAAAPAKKQPKTKKQNAAMDDSPKSVRGRSAYMIFLCAERHTTMPFLVYTHELRPAVLSYVDRFSEVVL